VNGELQAPVTLALEKNPYYAIRKFKAALKRFLLEGSYYTIQEYFDSGSLSNPSIYF
jgi:hypothetical protein